MRSFLTFAFILNFAWVCNSQTISKSVFSQDFNTSVIQNLVLKIKPANSNRKYMGYTLLIYVSTNEEIEISKFENADGEIRPIMEELEMGFVKSLDDIDLTSYKGCLIVFPIIFEMIGAENLEDNFSEGIKSMVPMITFEKVDCIQFQEPIIVLGKRGHGF